MSGQADAEPLSWRALLALLLAMFAISVGYGIVLPILPFLVVRLAGTNDPVIQSWHTGLVTGTYILAIFLFAPVWGKLSDRWGRRPVILLGLMGFASSVALFGLIESLPVLYLGRFLDGLFAAAIAPVTYALVGTHSPSKEWQARRFVLISIAGTAGFFAGPLLGGAVLQASRLLNPEAIEIYSLPFFAASILALAAAAAVWTLVPGTDQLQRNRPSSVGTHRDPKVILRLYIVAFVTAGAIGAFEVGLALRGKQILEMDATRIGMMFAECSLVMFVAQVIVFSPIIKPESTRWLLTPGLAVLALGLVFVPFTNTPMTLSIAVALVAASAGILSPIATYWASLNAGERQGADLGRMTASASLGQALGSAAGGLLFDAPLLPGSAFTVTAVIVLVGAIASLGLPKLLVPPLISLSHKSSGSDDDANRPATTRALRHPHEHG